MKNCILVIVDFDLYRKQYSPVCLFTYVQLCIQNYQASNLLQIYESASLIVQEDVQQISGQLDAFMQP